MLPIYENKNFVITEILCVLFRLHCSYLEECLANRRISTNTSCCLFSFSCFQIKNNPSFQASLMWNRFLWCLTLGLEGSWPVKTEDMIELLIKNRNQFNSMIL